MGLLPEVPRSSQHVQKSGGTSVRSTRKYFDGLRQGRGFEELWSLGQDALEFYRCLHGNIGVVRNWRLPATILPDVICNMVAEYLGVKGEHVLDVRNESFDLPGTIGANEQMRVVVKVVDKSILAQSPEGAVTFKVTCYGSDGKTVASGSMLILVPRAPKKH